MNCGELDKIVERHGGTGYRANEFVLVEIGHHATPQLLPFVRSACACATAPSEAETPRIAWPRLTTGRWRAHCHVTGVGRANPPHRGESLYTIGKRVARRPSARQRLLPRRGVSFNQTKT
jgi:hypothetical protein